MSIKAAESPGTLPTAAATPEERDARFVWHPWSPSRAVRKRLMITRGQGIRVWDMDGRQYIDASSLNSTCGYGCPEVIAAAEQQLRTLHATDLSALNHPVAGKLAEAIASLLPEPLSRTMLLNSGSEGIEAALLVAAFHRRMAGDLRTRVVTFARGYHGSTVLTRSLSGLPPTGHPFADPLEVTRVELPAAPAQLRGPESAPALLDAFDTALEAGSPPLAVVVEPMLNVGGGVVLPTGFLTGLRELCDRTGTLLIIDEVFTGIGRTGRMFAFEHESMQPDIVVSSKGLGGGYGPISAVTGRQDVYETFAGDELIGGLRYGHTTAGHPVASAAALATLAVVQRDGLVANAADRGRELLAALEPLRDEPGIVDVRGSGLVAVVELDDIQAASRLVAAAQEAGLLLRQQANAVFACPPLVVTADQTAVIADRIVTAGRSVRRLGVRPA